jgi:L-fuculose-phosphate aldolase
MERYAGVKFSIAPGALVPAAFNAARVAELVKQAKRIAAAGLAPANTGNLSVRTGSSFLITAAGARLATLTSADISEVLAFDFDAYALLRYRGALPSSETALHCLIYTRRSDVGAIAHAHDELLIKPSIAKELGIPVAAEYPYGTKELALETAHALGAGSVVAMRNHGVVSVGKNLTEAVGGVMRLHKEALR